VCYHALVRGWWLVLALAAVAGCKTRLAPPTHDMAVAPPPDLGHLDVVTASCRQDNPGNKIDLLFLIDNSRSMDLMQDELRRRFPQFLQRLVDLAHAGTNTDLHVGVVTSDYGAGYRSFPNSGCDASPGGQRGILQPLGENAPVGCQPPVGANYIAYTFDGFAGGPNNLPNGQDLAATFTCMASVGSSGCGDEHVLEAAYQALSGKIPENAGFLRDNALLVVVFLTNEDDCSAPPDSDLFDPMKMDWGAWTSFRCTRAGIVCGQPPAPPPLASSNGPLMACTAAPNPNGAGPGKLYDVGRYTDFFTRPAIQGGVKESPFDVVLVGIAAPPEPFEVVIADNQLYDQDLVLCARAGGSCQPTLQRSCKNQSVYGFYGDPAVRLAQVVNAAPNHGFSSICEGDYADALDQLSHLVVSQLGECCIPQPLPPDPNRPGEVLADCTVVEVTQHEDGSTTSSPVPSCNDSPPTCWRAVMKDRCAGQSPQRIGIEIDRGGGPVPDHTTARATCVVLGA
jgi:hypothetical protein